MAASPLKSASRAPEIPEYRSPEVAPDGRVTVRYYHPAAREVSCEWDWKNWAPTPMQRDAAGLWSCTTEPLPPDIYEYSLFADGARVIDYQNPSSKNRFAFFAHVPGGRIFEPRGAPHGTVHTHWYRSPVTGGPRRMHVYTPPGYEAGGEPLPALYLLHGAGDDDETWVRTGRMNFIMDNLLAEGRARPTVVVMPDGHILGANWKEDREAKIRAFAEEFHRAVIPEAERLYRIAAGPKLRAMAGLSMGGGQTLAVGMTRPEMFGAFGLFSSGLWPEITPMIEAALPQLRAHAPDPLWIGIGRRDFLYEHCALLRRTLDQGGVQYGCHEDDSTHCWRTWRDYLERFAPLLFRGP